MHSSMVSGFGKHLHIESSTPQRLTFTLPPTRTYLLLSSSLILDTLDQLLQLHHDEESPQSPQDGVYDRSLQRPIPATTPGELIACLHHSGSSARESVPTGPGKCIAELITILGLWKPELDCGQRSPICIIVERESQTQLRSFVLLQFG